MTGVGFHRLWNAVTAEPVNITHANGEALHALTAKILAAEDMFIGAMSAGYHEEQSRRLLADKSGRSVLIDSLLHGRLYEQRSLWEVTDYLRLPTAGPFVVVAAETPFVGGSASWRSGTSRASATSPSAPTRHFTTCWPDSSCTQVWLKPSSAEAMTGNARSTRTRIPVTGGS